MLLQLDVERLVVSDVHEVDRGATLLDHAQGVGVLGVVEASQGTVVDAEAVAPYVEDALLDRGVGGRLVSRSGASCGRASGGRVGDGSTGDAFATQSLARAAECACGRGAFGRLCFGSAGLST